MEAGPSAPRSRATGRSASCGGAIIRTDTPRSEVDLQRGVEVRPDAGPARIFAALAAPGDTGRGHFLSGWLGHVDPGDDAFVGVAALAPFLFLCRVGDQILCGLVLNERDAVAIDRALQDRPDIFTPTELGPEAAAIVRTQRSFQRLQAIMAPLRPAP